MKVGEVGMPDREMVMSALECLSDGRFCACCCYKPYDDCEKRVARDALAIMKGQEAVEPTIDEYGNKRCGNCGHKLQSIADMDLFCCKCGKPVLWEGR